MKEFLYEKLVRQPRHRRSKKEDAERITGELSIHWMEEPISPATTAKSARNFKRVICDYIAGMTDLFIYQQYEEGCNT